MLVALMIAAVVGFAVFRDAQMLEERGIRVGLFSPAGWGLATFLFAIVFGVLYLVRRPRLLRAAAVGSGPNCRRTLRDGDQFCGPCGCPVSLGAGQRHEP